MSVVVRALMASDTEDMLLPTELYDTSVCPARKSLVTKLDVSMLPMVDITLSMTVGVVV